MLAQMAALRDKLVADRRTSSSSQDPKSGRDLVLWALRRLASNASLTERLARCGTRPNPNKRFDCDSPACPVCAARAAKREFERKTAPALADFDRSRLRYVTILHLVTTDLDEGLHAMRTTESRALRFIARKSGVRWWGYREVELLRPADLPNFSERKRAMLLAMGFPTEATSPVALFHTHSIVDLGSCDEGTLDTMLRKRWGGISTGSRPDVHGTSHGAGERPETDALQRQSTLHPRGWRRSSGMAG